MAKPSSVVPSLGSGPTPDAPSVITLDLALGRLRKHAVSYAYGACQAQGVMIDDLQIALAEMDSLRADLAAARSLLRDATRDTERLDWMEDSRLGIEAITMDDPFGEPTRKMWVVDDADQSCVMPTIREAVDRAQTSAVLSAASIHASSGATTEDQT
jgi:hypothetical protein